LVAHPGPPEEAFVDPMDVVDDPDEPDDDVDIT